MSTSSGQILSNKHTHVMRETSRSSRRSDHSLAAVHSRGGDATSRWFLHVGWLMTLRAANLPAAPKWLGPVLRVKSRTLQRLMLST
jgi:hypothetical protein